MENVEIRSRVEEQVGYWLSRQKERLGKEISISDKAIEFIVQVIENIKEDPSARWAIKDNYNSFQDIAIQLIPRSLTRSIYNQRYYRNTHIAISSWELLDQFPNILSDFCFIPEDDM